MARVKVRTYLSPTLVLLAFDWPDGEGRDDFLGFAIERQPGFGGAPRSWLPNRIGFGGPARRGDLPSDTSPIQKFLWWDARIDDDDRGATFRYTVTPVVGRPGATDLLTSYSRTVTARLPRPVEAGIGTWFNRAVVSSQAFAARFGRRPPAARLPDALRWLANGMEEVIPSFLAGSPRVDGAIYHLTDRQWTIPALAAYRGRASMVFNRTARDHESDDAVAALPGIEFLARTRANIMHNKFLVRTTRGRPVVVLTGSANFTTGGLATQANVLHTFASPSLAGLYLERKRLLALDPTVGATAQGAGWSDPIELGDARIRAFFPPEPTGRRASIDAVVAAVEGATSSVLFCLFKPTDRDLLDAVLAHGERGGLMLGLVNALDRADATGEPGADAGRATVAVYHRHRRARSIVDHSIYAQGSAPTNFWWESARLPGMGGRFPVYIHHKFVVVDAETDHPVVFTGSANMSNNSLHRNDENLLEIRGSRKLAAIYLAEGLRLYEHYRARAAWNDWERSGRRPQTYSLAPNASWAAAAYRPGTSQHRSRVALSSSPG